MSRQLSGLLLRELVRGDTLAAHAASALPCAFVACHDEDTDVCSIWKDVWEEGTGSPAAAVRLYVGEISALICSGMRINMVEALITYRAQDLLRIHGWVM